MMTPSGRCLVRYWSWMASISDSSVMGLVSAGRITDRKR